MHRARVDCALLQSGTRTHVEQRRRAGMLEQGTVDTRREAGTADRLDREGSVHRGIELCLERERHRVDFPSPTGGRTGTIHARTELVKEPDRPSPRRRAPAVVRRGSPRSRNRRATAPLCASGTRAFPAAPAGRTPTTTRTPGSASSRSPAVLRGVDPRAT
ncbi:FAD-dependent monooxygenase [Streptomyces sp. NPDC018693]|uniref:FAD-dependent monooxygenase n=1 Tax=unclassified Streptomyces TaxID=2593676 RepID=UPI003790D405